MNVENSAGFRVGEGSASDSLTPLLVATCGRNGSTMTMALLATSPQVAMDREHPFERPYFAWMAEWSLLADRTEWDSDRWDIGALWQLQYGHVSDGLMGPPPWTGRRLWDARDDGGGIGPDLLQAAWREFSVRATDRTRRDLGAHGTRVRYHAEKAVHVARLREISPLPLRSIVVHRDPRDVWLSVQAFDRARGFYGFGRRPQEAQEEWFERFLAMQAQWLRNVLIERERPDSMVVAYADLVSRAEATAARLGDWLELELDPTGPIKHLRNRRDHSTSTSPEASVDRWKRELEPQWRERFAAVLGPELREIGYDP